MVDPDVRIVQLEPMKVAVFYGFGKTPETQAHNDSTEWLKSVGLYDDPDNYRSFGFNNPDPTPGSPNYGYEVWIPIEPGIDVGKDVKTKEFPGGLFAVTPCDSLSTIGLDWKRLVAWRVTSKYKQGHQPCLEELLTKPGMDEDDYRFNLYLSILE